MFSVMKTSHFLFAAAASVAVLFATSALATPLTDVVYGNLGATGTAGLSDTNTDYGPTLATKRLAQGFTTGTSQQFLQLQSVTLGLFSDEVPSARTVGIYSDNAGVPGTLLYTSSSENVTSVGKYTFTFSNEQLAASTSYWIVPEAPASWYRDELESQPQGQNSSGWAWFGTKRETAPDTWSNNPSSLSVAVQAVPEPSTYALAGIGLATAGLIRWRRRKAAGLRS
jgi:hypothetical protein